MKKSQKFKLSFLENFHGNTLKFTLTYQSFNKDATVLRSRPIKTCAKISIISRSMKNLGQN